MVDRSVPLRFTTWLAPGLPLELFSVIAEHVSRGLGREYELSVEPKMSGPLSEADDRFATGLTDIGFICPPSYLWLTGRSEPSVRLVPVAPVFDDPRIGGRPVYVSDLVVRADSGIGSFDDLAGRVVGFNEHASLSGFVCLLDRLDRGGHDLSFFGELRQVGSHRNALDLIETGEIDAAAIDTNVWRTWQQEWLERVGALTTAGFLGPHPVQPVVTRASAGPELSAAVAEQLVRPELIADLARFGVLDFAPVTVSDYLALAPAVDRALAMVPPPGRLSREQGRQNARSS